MGGRDTAERVVVVDCPDWPVAAAAVAGQAPVVVVYANRVVSASRAARADGVVAGLRRREAQGRCPGAVVIERDLVGEARAFEAVAVAVEQFCPRIEITRPGLLVFGARGPARYFGGEQALAARVRQQVQAVVVERGDTGPVGVGIADGVLAARVAARASSSAGSPEVVESGASAGYLARCLVEELERPELSGLLRRLGIATLGAVAAMPSVDLVARFGPEGERAHRLACGLDERVLDARAVPADLSVEIELDPPASRIDQVAFTAKGLAEQLHERLARQGLACTQVAIEAQTESGERRCRWWRHQGALSAPAVAERVRWQLDGWLHGPCPPTAGIVRLRLVPDEVTADRGRQLGFWGGQTDNDDRALRALVRLAAHLGQPAVQVPVAAGGRGVDARYRLEPLEQVDVLGRLEHQVSEAPVAPWPGQLPVPSPAIVHGEPVPVEVFDDDDAPVVVSGRGELSAPPQRWVAGGRSTTVVAWAGPWCVEERWWDPRRSRRHARLQLVGTDGVAVVLTRQSGSWWWEATYD